MTRFLRLSARQGLAVLAMAVLAGLGGCAGSKSAPRPAAGPGPSPAAVTAEPPKPIIDKTLFTLPQLRASGREPIRVGVLLPLSGAQAALGHALLDSAELAIFESGRKDLLLLPEDTQSTAAGAADAMSKTVAQGAEIVLGPVMAEEVSAATPIGQANKIPLIAFSSTLSVAQRGVYLLSFPPALEVERVIGHAAANGKTHIAALIPDNSYGTVIESALKDAASAHNITLGPIEHYETNVTAMQAPVRALAQAGGFDAVLLPDGGSNLRALGPLLSFTGIDTQKVKVLGTGLWDDPSLSREASLQGGWFAAPPPDARVSFAQRYKAAYGVAAPRIASLAYDGVALVAALAEAPAGARFTPERIASPSGFVGVDGVFRFDTDGRIIRALAVNEVTPTGIAVVSPAPTTFQGNSQ